LEVPVRSEVGFTTEYTEIFFLQLLRDLRGIDRLGWATTLWSLIDPDAQNPNPI